MFSNLPLHRFLLVILAALSGLFILKLPHNVYFYNSLGPYFLSFLIFVASSYFLSGILLYLFSSRKIISILTSLIALILLLALSAVSMLYVVEPLQQNFAALIFILFFVFQLYWIAGRFKLPFLASASYSIGVYLAGVIGIFLLSEYWSWQGGVVALTPLIASLALNVREGNPSHKKLIQVILTIVPSPLILLVFLKELPIHTLFVMLCYIAIFRVEKADNPKKYILSYLLVILILAWAAPRYMTFL